MKNILTNNKELCNISKKMIKIVDDSRNKTL